MKRLRTLQTGHSAKAIPRPSFSWLLFIPIILSVAGLFFVFEASSIRSFTDFHDSFHYLKLQAIWICIGVSAMVFFSMFNYKHWYSLAFPFFSVTIILLLIVLIPHVGSKVGGARRWIDLGFFSLQPTEFAKLATIIYLSSWFMKKEKNRFLSFFVLVGLLMGLILLQPDMGTAIIIFCLSVILYFLAGNDVKHLLLFLPASAAAFLVLIKISPYRFSRLTAFLNPEADPTGQGITYHIRQILISLTNGGLFGQGLGISRQKYLFLPEAHTDSIFAIIGEEVGFVGSLALIILFIILIYQIYRVANKTHDKFGQLLAGGIFAFFSVQVIVNLASMVNLMPLTGVPLPFISYGGSNILTSFTLIGIAINIAKHSKGVEG